MKDLDALPPRNIDCYWLAAGVPGERSSGQVFMGRGKADLGTAALTDPNMNKAANLFADLLGSLGLPGLRLEASQYGATLRLWVVSPELPDLELRVRIADLFGEVFDVYPGLRYDYMVFSEEEFLQISRRGSQDNARE